MPASTFAPRSPREFSELALGDVLEDVRQKNNNSLISFSKNNSRNRFFPVQINRQEGQMQVGREPILYFFEERGCVRQAFERFRSVLVTAISGNI